MTQRWVCSENTEHVFDSITSDGLCPTGDGGVLVQLEEVRLPTPGNDISLHTGKSGLGILVFDLSGSMKEQIDPVSESPLTKINAVASAFGTTVASLLHGGSEMKQPDDYFLALVGFAEGAELLGFYNLPSMKQGDYESTVAYWKQFVLDAFERFGALTNITAGLTLANEIYRQALNGRLPSSQYAQQVPALRKFALGSHRLVVKGEPVAAPNIRVLVYSDGEHNVGSFDNPFSKVSLVDVASESGRMVNGLMSIYFGSPVREEGKTEEGAKQMEEIAGICPIHGHVGYIPVFRLTHYKYLRRLLHLSSAASGFCLQCAHEQVKVKQEE